MEIRRIMKVWMAAIAMGVMACGAIGCGDKPDQTAPIQEVAHQIDGSSTPKTTGAPVTNPNLSVTPGTAANQPAANPSITPTTPATTADNSPAKPTVLAGDILKLRMEAIRGHMPGDIRTATRKGEPVQGFFSGLAFTEVADGHPCVKADYVSTSTTIVSAPGEKDFHGKDVVLHYDQTATVIAVLAGVGRNKLFIEIDTKYSLDGWIRTRKEILSGRMDNNTLEDDGTAAIVPDGTMLKFTKGNENAYVMAYGELVLFATEVNGLNTVGNPAQGIDLGSQLITVYTTRDLTGMGK